MSTMERERSLMPLLVDWGLRDEKGNLTHGVVSPVAAAVVRSFS